MRFFVVYLILAVLFVLIPGCKAEAVSEVPIDHTNTISNFHAQLSMQTPYALALQRKLVQWYNLNLASENPEDGFADAYNSILYYENGIMGYLEIPGAGVCIPIYHGENMSEGFGHLPQSAFPIGGEGNHSVLTYSGTIPLQVGDCFEIHILQDVVTYQVQASKDGGEDICTLEIVGVPYHGHRIMTD